MKSDGDGMWVAIYGTAASCNKRNPGSGCDAIGGLNRMHAILGASDACIATHPSDMAVTMAALAAEVELLGADQTARRVAIGLRAAQGYGNRSRLS